MDWNKLAAEAHQVAVEKGWWDKPVPFDEIAIECHAALARAWEEHKAGRPNLYHLCQPSGEKHLPCYLDCDGKKMSICFMQPCNLRDPKPRGVAAELAGCVLRLLDWLEVQRGKDVAIRTFPWGTDLLEMLNDCHLEISRAARFSRFTIDTSDDMNRNIITFVERVLNWGTGNRVDMKAVLREVLEYNKAKTRRRGGAEP